MSIDARKRSIPIHPICPRDLQQHGTKYNQVITITGANGKQIDVIFAWIRYLEGMVRLVTASPAEKEEAVDVSRI